MPRPPRLRPEHPLLPAPRGPVRDLALRERTALLALYAGTATGEELALLETSVAVALALAQRGYGALWGQALKAAAQTLRTPQPDGDLVADALTVHDHQRKVAPQRQYIAALTSAATAAP